MTERPECPACGVKNEPPTNRYEESREMRCTGCNRPLLVRTHLRYSAEPLPDDTAQPNGGDFVCGRVEDRTLVAGNAEALRIASSGDVAKQRSADVWALFIAEWPELAQLRTSSNHNFQLLKDNVTLRIYHPKGCECSTTAIATK